jgi:hypothetical protein
LFDLHNCHNFITHARRLGKVRAVKLFQENRRVARRLSSQAVEAPASGERKLRRCGIAECGMRNADLKEDETQRDFHPSFNP